MKRMGWVLSYLMVGAVSVGAGLWLGPYASAAYQRAFPEPTFERADNTAYLEPAGVDVVVFGTSTCPYCAKTRALLVALGVPYREHLVDQSAQAQQLYRSLDASGVPVILIGDRRIHGFNESAIREALSAHDLPSPGSSARDVSTTGTTPDMESPI